jgi:hypothetical protein
LDQRSGNDGEWIADVVGRSVAPDGSAGFDQRNTAEMVHEIGESIIRRVSALDRAVGEER